jgi:DNA recombination-dependent growth factor C
VQRCLKDDMELTHLGFELGSTARAVLDARGVVTKLELLGQDALAEGNEDALARQDAEIALVGGTLRELLAVLRRALGGDAAAAAPRRPTAPAPMGAGAAPPHLSLVTA